WKVADLGERAGDHSDLGRRLGSRAGRLASRLGHVLCGVFPRWPTRSHGRRRWRRESVGHRLFGLARAWRRLEAPSERDSTPSHAGLMRLRRSGHWSRDPRPGPTSVNHDNIIAIHAARTPRRRPQELNKNAHARSMLGRALLGQKRRTEAEPLLVQGYEGMKQRAAKIPIHGKPSLAAALERLVALYDASAKPEQAARWRGELERVKADAKQLHQ